MHLALKIILNTVLSIILGIYLYCGFAAGMTYDLPSLAFVGLLIGLLIVSLYDIYSTIIRYRNHHGKDKTAG
jgi:hypothetical protein